MSGRTSKRNRICIFVLQSLAVKLPLQSELFYLLFILIVRVTPCQCITVFILEIYLQVLQLQEVVLHVRGVIDAHGMNIPRNEDS